MASGMQENYSKRFGRVKVSSMPLKSWLAPEDALAVVDNLTIMGILKF